MPEVRAERLGGRHGDCRAELVAPPSDTWMDSALCRPAREGMMSLHWNKVAPSEGTELELLTPVPQNLALLGLFYFFPNNIKSNYLDFFLLRGR